LKRIQLIGFITLILLGITGCWNDENKLDTSLLKTLDNNSYVFPAYEVILGEMPFKAQLPTYIPFKGTTASRLWETSNIFTNDSLEEVSVQLSVETILPEDVPEKLLVVASNFKDKSWGSDNMIGEVKLDSGAYGKFHYARDSEDNHVEVRFNRDGVYYIIIYYSYMKTKEEKEKELIKIANSLVDYDNWYDETYLSPKSN
jgi:hypothetical protein